MAIYKISFLPASKFGSQIDFLAGGPRLSNENWTETARKGKFLTPEGFSDSDYVDVWIDDSDTTFNDLVVGGTHQKLAAPLHINGTTYPIGTTIHTGYRLDVDSDRDGLIDNSIWTININAANPYLTIGIASLERLTPGVELKVLGGGDSQRADIENPELLFCFAAGTLIATPSGECAVEALAPGDEVATADGRAVPVRWIGRQTVRRAAASGRMAPVRIAAGALGAGPDGEGLPRRDLVVTADHALILGGLAVTAGALVDGRGIRRLSAAELPERATFYHIETEAHDVVLAEGAPAETWVDHAERARFDNYDEYLRLWGEDRRIVESPLPRITAARQLPAALRSKLGLAPLQASAA